MAVSQIYSSFIPVPSSEAKLQVLTNDIYNILHTFGNIRWLSARLQFLESVNNGDTAILL